LALYRQYGVAMSKDAVFMMKLDPDVLAFHGELICPLS